MSQLNVDAIRASNGTGDAISLTASDKTCTANITNNLSNRNLIINGAMQVWQRGTSSTTDGYGSVDRFSVKSSGADEAPTHAQVNVASGTTPYTLGFRKALKITNGNQTSGAGAADWMEIGYKIEAQDIANSGWNYLSTSSYITLSYWVKSSVAQTFYGYMFNRDGTIRSYPWSTGSLSADTWTKVTKTIPGYTGLQFDNNNGAGLEIYFPLFNGTDMTNNSRSLNSWATHDGAAQTPDQTSTWYTTNDSTFEITGVQLEVGDYATDFEHRSYGDELARCQRYYHRIHPTANGDVLTGSAWAPFQNVAQGITFFPVDMRTRVTALEQSGTAGDYQVSHGSSGGDCSAVPTFQHGGLNCAATSFTLSGTPWSVGDAVRPSNKNTDGFLAWSAEL